MKNLVKLRYVGKKPSAYDSVARSGVVWNGHGDVQEVTDAQAKLLLRYPDQWALVNEKDQAAVDAPVSISVTEEDGGQVAIDPETLKMPLERMSKTELRAYAKQKWGKDMDSALGKKAMIDQVEEWERDLDLAPVGV